jgi:hypothetical protein
VEWCDSLIRQNILNNLRVTDFYKIVGFGIKNCPGNNINDIGCFIGREHVKVIYCPSEIDILPNRMFYSSVFPAELIKI